MPRDASHWRTEGDESFVDYLGQSRDRFPGRNLAQGCRSRSKFAVEATRRAPFCDVHLSCRRLQWVGDPVTATFNAERHGLYAPAQTLFSSIYDSSFVGCCQSIRSPRQPCVVYCNNSRELVVCTQPSRHSHPAANQIGDSRGSAMRHRHCLCTDYNHLKSYKRKSIPLAA
jgi:hypothetical protein